MTGTTYLVKANDLVVSHCRCPAEQALMTFPAQADCPWCGCGWLFTCIACRKAYTFARAVELDASLEDLARRDLASGWFRGKPVPEDEVANWIDFMSFALRDVIPGQEYVILDSHILSTERTHFSEEGVYAQHDLAFLPQVRALRDPTAIAESIGSKAYWLKHAVP